MVNVFRGIISGTARWQNTCLRPREHRTVVLARSVERGGLSPRESPLHWLKGLSDSEKGFNLARQCKRECQPYCVGLGILVQTWAGARVAGRLAAVRTLCNTRILKVPSLQLQCLIGYVLGNPRQIWK